MKKDTIIILSGGMDSVTLLYDQQERIALAVSFDYGSNHNAREIPFAKLHCERLGIKHVVIPLDFMAQYFRSSLLEGAEAIPEGHYADENMRSTVVPFRNGIMLAIAVGMAESNGLRFVMSDCSHHLLTGRKESLPVEVKNSALITRKRGVAIKAAKNTVESAAHVLSGKRP